MSQKLDILEMLKRGPVTPIYALTHLGCFRLAARVNELRNDGYPIVTNTMRQGDKEFASYELEQRPC